MNLQVSYTHTTQSITAKLTSYATILAYQVYVYPLAAILVDWLLLKAVITKFKRTQAKSLKDTWKCFTGFPVLRSTKLFLIYLTHTSLHYQSVHFLFNRQCYSYVTKVQIKISRVLWLATCWFEGNKDAKQPTCSRVY